MTDKTARTAVTSASVNGGTAVMTPTPGFFTGFFVPAFALVFAIVFLLGCDQPKKAPEPHRVWDVSIGDLLRTGKTYVGHTVRIRLPAGSYTVRREGLDFPSLRVGDPPAGRFLCRTPPGDNSKCLIIIGTVDHVVRDGVPRMVGVDYQTVVRDCTVMVDPAP